MPWRRGSAGADANDGQPPYLSGLGRVTWAEVVLRAVVLGSWRETARLCAVLLFVGIAGAGCHALACWLGTLL